MADSDNKRLLAALAANLQAEMEGHYTYYALAKRENDPQRRNALRGLAAAEKHHASLWAEPSWNSVDKCPSTRGVNSDRLTRWRRR
jgi:Mn-containing catalase